MPVDYIVLPEGTLVIERWTGFISHAELIEHEKQQLNDKAIAPGAAILVDAEQARFSETSLEKVHELSDLYAEASNRIAPAKIALLVSAEDWLKAKVFQAQARAHGVTVITFISLNVACLWLGIEPRTAAHYLELLASKKPRPPVRSQRETMTAD